MAQAKARQQLIDELVKERGRVYADINARVASGHSQVELDEKGRLIRKDTTHESEYLVDRFNDLSDKIERVAGSPIIPKLPQDDG